MAETIKSTNLELANNATHEKNEWDKLTSLFQENKNSIPRNSRQENLILEQDKEQQVTKARESVMNSIGLASTEGEKQPEMTTFCGQEIPRELLGEDKILIDEVKPRLKLDFIGCKKDKQNLSTILDMRDGIDEEVFKANFTPQVAALYLKEFNNGNIFNNDRFSSTVFSRVFEALDLNTQASFLNRLHILDLQGLFDYTSDSIKEKSLAYLSTLLESKTLEDETFTKEVTIQFIANSVEQFNIHGDEGLRVFNKLTNSYDKNPNKDNYTLNLLKIKLAAATLDRESFNANFDKIINQDYIESGNFDVYQMATLQYAFGSDKENDELQQKIDSLSPVLALFAKHHIKQKLKYQDAYIETENINENRAEEIKKLVDGCVNLISDRKTLSSLACVGDDNAIRIMRQIQEGSSIDSDLKNNIEKYLQGQLQFQTSYLSPFMYSSGQTSKESSPVKYRYTTYEGLSFNIPINNIEELRNYDELYQQSFFIALEEMLKEKNPDFARDSLSRFIYGSSLEEIGLNLTALGLMEDKKVGSRGYSSKYLEKHSSKDITINKKALDDLINVNQEFSDDFKNLVLDAIDLFYCRDNDLLPRYHKFIDEGNTRDTKLGDILRKVRIEKTKVMSKNYSEYMKKMISIGTENIGNIEYGESKIPLLEMKGDDFMLLVHHLGAYSDHKGDNPAEWNTNKTISYSMDGHSVGYISTCAIAPRCIYLAATEEEVNNPEEIYYSFSNFSENTILFASENDLYTTERRNSNKDVIVSASRPTFIDEDPHAIIERTKQTIAKNDNGHNEVVLDRYSGTGPGGRLQPDYLIVWQNDPSKISEKVKEHAAYFGIPIMMVDYQKYK